MKEVYEFLNNAKTYYLGTIDDDKPRVRPFGTVNIFEEKLYIQTGKVKDVYRQISKNSNVEICAMYNEKWIRISANLVLDDRIEAKKSMLDAYPNLRGMYNEEDDNTAVLYLKNVKATIYSFSMDPKVIEF